MEFKTLLFRIPLIIPWVQHTYESFVMINKGNNFPTRRIFIQDSQSLSLITVSIFLWICVGEVNAPKSAFSTAAPWMVLSQRHSCLSSSLCGLPGNDHRKPVCVLLWGKGFCTCTQMYFLLMLYNLLPSFESPGTFLCILMTSSSSYKTWLEERENRWGLNFNASHSALTAPSHQAALLFLLPPHFSYPTKTTKRKTNQENVS